LESSPSSPVPISFETIFTTAILAVIAFVVAYFRKAIYYWWLKRKIQPKLDKIVQSYQNEIGAYVETRPQLIVTTRKPSEETYGIIFVTPDEILAVEQQFILSIPIACSLRKIRLLLDTNLKRALFDFLSWRLAVVHGREDLASQIYDHATTAYPDDFDAIHRLHAEAKLSNIVLQEALRRLRKYSDLRQVSPGDVREFSDIFREWARRDFSLIIIGGETDKYTYIDMAMDELAKHRELLLLTRGLSIAKLVDVVNGCKKRDSRLKDYKKDTDSWYYPSTDHTVSSLRVWISRGPVADVVQFRPVE
jgi:hypothetical protein